MKRAVHKRKPVIDEDSFNPDEDESETGSKKRDKPQPIKPKDNTVKTRKPVIDLNSNDPNLDPIKHLKDWPITDDDQDGIDANKGNRIPTNYDKVKVFIDEKFRQGFLNELEKQGIDPKKVEFHDRFKPGVPYRIEIDETPSPSSQPSDNK